VLRLWRKAYWILAPEQLERFMRPALLEQKFIGQVDGFEGQWSGGFGRHGRPPGQFQNSVVFTARSIDYVNYRYRRYPKLNRRSPSLGWSP
jgi:hypothetical protein